MRPGEANLYAADNSYDERTITIPGFASAVGVSAAVQFRQRQDDSSALYLTIDSGANGGLALASDGANLLIAWTITDAQLDALRAALAAARLSVCHWSLKLTVGGRPYQYLYGTYTPIATATT